MKKYILILILILGAFFRLLMLSEVPAGITSDEANTGYDAYSLLLTGRDQWNQSFPLTSFLGFGDNRSPLYTYLVIPFLIPFDLSPLAVRLPSAIAGIASILLMYLYSRKLFGEKVGLLAAFLLSISPWGLSLSRQGIESNVAMAFLILGLYFASNLSKSKKYFYFSIVSFILTFYTYTSYIVFTPLLVGAILVCSKELRKMKKELLIGAIVFAIGISPLIMSSSAGSTRFSQVGLTSDITSLGLLDVVNQKIGSCQEYFPPVVCRIVFNKLFTFSSVFFQNYLHHFSFDFLFLKGTTTQYSLLYERGLLYIYEVVFLLAGVFYVIKRKVSLLVLLLLLLSPIPDALSGGGHHSRASVMLPFLIVLQALGLNVIWQFLFKLKKTILRTGAMVAVVLLIVFSATSLLITYFNFFKKYHSHYSLYSYRELSKDLPIQKNNYEHVFISNYKNDAPQYIFYLFYNKYNPAAYQAKKEVEYERSSNGFLTVNRIENIHFSNFIVNASLPEEIQKYPNSLLIAHPDAFSEKISYVKTYNDLTGGINFEAVEYKEVVKTIKPNE